MLNRISPEKAATLRQNRRTTVLENHKNAPLLPYTDQSPYTIEVHIKVNERDEKRRIAISPEEYNKLIELRKLDQALTEEWKKDIRDACTTAHFSPVMQECVMHAMHEKAPQKSTAPLIHPELENIKNNTPDYQYKPVPPGEESHHRHYHYGQNQNTGRDQNNH